jgi:hypothetical protein
MRLARAALAITSEVHFSNPAKNDGFLRAIKIRSATSFGGEAKPLAPRSTILQHVKYPCELWKNFVG